MDLFVKKLFNVDQKQIEEIFSEYNASKITLIHYENTITKGFAHVTIPEEQNALLAIKQLHNLVVNGKNIIVQKNESQINKNKTSKPKLNKPKTNKPKTNKNSNDRVIPYVFIKRKNPEKIKYQQWHNELCEGNIDVSFEIEWKTLTATALNPCNDEEVGTQPSCCCKDDEYKGYDKRWLMTSDNKLAISPFTVKSAIANGYANIMGSCYRVIDKDETTSKTRFSHIDSVPKIYKSCCDTDLLCPRCLLFGMTGGEQKQEQVSALKGRFKSATLINDLNLISKIDDKEIPMEKSKEKIKTKIRLWKNKEDISKLMCKQFLLPYFDVPKSNKQNGGYYNKNFLVNDAKEMKGVKNYLYSEPSKMKTLQDIENKIMDIDRIDIGKIDTDKKYKHSLRNFGVVCKEEMIFKGVVGIENATKDEVAAILSLLEKSLGNHIFKLGLGKSLGMGAVESTVTSAWIRKKDDYKWTKYTWEKNTREKDIKLAEFIKNAEIEKEINIHKIVSSKLQEQIKLNKSEIAEYPPPGNRYWSMLKSTINMNI